VGYSQRRLGQQAWLNFARIAMSVESSLQLAMKESIAAD